MHEDEYRNRAFFDNVRDAILVADTDRRIIDCNQAFSDLFGYRLPELEGAQTEVVYADPADFAAMGQAIRTHLDETNFFLTVDYRTKAGETFPGETNVFYLEDGNGSPRAYVGSIRDVTHRKQREAKEALLTDVSRHVGEAASFQEGLELTLQDITAYTDWTYAEAWIPDEEGQRLEFGAGHTGKPGLDAFRTASRTIEFPAGEGLPGRVYASQNREWIPDVAAVSRNRFHRRELAREHGVRAAFGIPLVEDGEVLAVLTFFLTTRRETDERLVEDITDVVTALGALVAKKRAQDEILAQKERLATFASIVSHDLRNPLNVAQSRLELAMDDVESENLQAVSRSLDRMEALIEDMLALAKSGEELGEFDTIDLAETARRSWESVVTGPATLSTESNDTIHADESRLRQLLENLFRNAVVHAGDDVAVSVGALEDGFYVEDDGPGIPTEDRAAVFEAGYTTSRTGTGFGLAIVEEIADAHGWEVRVTEGASGGARFEITGVESLPGE
jgi:PAS domain S-box-containing protein